MGIQGAFTNCGIFVQGYNLTGKSNRVELNIAADIRERQCFGDLGKVRGYGLETVNAVIAGFSDLGLDEQDFGYGGNMFGSGLCVSIHMPAAGGAAPAEGARSFFFQGSIPKHDFGGKHGDDLLFGLELQGDSSGYPTGIGNVLNPGLVAVSANGNGNGIQLPAVTAAQYVYAILHVTEVSASDSIIVTIQSAPASNFAAPTTRFTFASKSAAGAEFATRLAGPITDTYWRAVHAVTGAGVSIKYACSIAVR